MKYCGVIGYSLTKETSPGVWTEQITERKYYGDVNRVFNRWASSETLNDDLNISNEFSIIADPFAFHNYQRIRYIEWMGALWKVNNVEVQYPRLKLSVGGVYNGESPRTSECSC